MNLNDFDKKQINALKYPLISNLQKSIRRGLTQDAINTWNVLKTNNTTRSHCLMRLAVIAVEDIGYGRSSVVNEFLSSEIKKKVIEERGGDEYIEKIIISMCRAIKDDLCTQLYFIVNNPTIVREFFNRWCFIEDEKALAEIYLSPKKTIIDRAIAFNTLLGFKKIKNPNIMQYQGQNFNLKIDDQNELLSFITELHQSMGLNEQVNDIFLKSYVYHKEPFVYNYPLAYSEYQKVYGGLEINDFINKDNYKDEVIHNAVEDYYVDFYGFNLLAGAMDSHTSIGKASIAELNNSFIRSSPDKVGASLFRVNGGVRDKTLARRLSVRDILGLDSVEPEIDSIVRRHISDYAQIVQKNINRQI